MIKILRYELPNSDDRQQGASLQPRFLYEIEVILGSLKLQIVDSHTEKAFSVALDIAENLGRVLKVDLADGQEVKELKVYELYGFASRTSGLVNTALPADDCSVAKIAFECSGDMVLLLSQAHGDIGGFENIVIGKEKTQTGYFREHSDIVRDRLSGFDNKRRLINRIDYYDSLSYLEAQVDLLTRIVLQSNTTENSLLELLGRADQESILNIKTPASIEQEFAVNKKHMRELQGEYYARKNSTN